MAAMEQILGGDTHTIGGGRPLPQSHFNLQVLLLPARLMPAEQVQMK